MKGENQSLPTPLYCTSAERSPFTTAQQISHVLMDFSEVKPISSSHVSYLFSFGSSWFACQQGWENQSKTYWSQRRERTQGLTSLAISLDARAVWNGMASSLKS